ncbi:MULTISPECIES: DUF1488 family protein [unclassified Shinella]|uniref:DUF1488 family protein n=1 Tax=unclassified Shinella TaxID=2643062 RepID=UPI00225D1476|nr:DUF1488 family protein [Shinella sp. YE25]MDC7254577.1 DUF1488 domain-containing protein [Shinella sp. YE25]CAI0337300.1 conserved hypothetical protein [Rhizobiaceae bacterium]CAK7255794.1 DUF1488 domain-containing protein [Shinella sp. WSC3-e]
MSLSFPNPSRSYEEAGKRVRFIGHNGVFEIPFFVAADLLSAATSEAGYLKAFDAARVAINTAALRAYSAARKPVYVLTRADFA